MMGIDSLEERMQALEDGGTQYPAHLSLKCMCRALRVGAVCVPKEYIGMIFRLNESPTSLLDTRVNCSGSGIPLD
jgi:hypothetical protein